jgi:hypothetical protein
MGSGVTGEEGSERGDSEGKKGVGGERKERGHKMVARAIRRIIIAKNETEWQASHAVELSRRMRDARKLYRVALRIVLVQVKLRQQKAFVAAFPLKLTDAARSAYVQRLLVRSRLAVLVDGVAQSLADANDNALEVVL